MKEMKHKRIFMSVSMAALVLVSLCAVGVSALSVSAASGSSSNVQSPLVGAAVGSGAPGVCSVNGADLNLFIRVAADNSLVWKESPDGTTWTSPTTSLGGNLAAPPAANATPVLTTGTNPSIFVFARGTDGVLYQLTISPTTPTGAIKQTDSSTYKITTWASLGGQLAANTGPSVCSWGPGRLDVFVQGTDGQMWHKWWNGAKWSGWESLSGKLTSAPGATATAASGSTGNQIGVFVAGTNEAIYYLHYSSTNAKNGWAGWVGVGGQALAGTSPAACSFGATRIDWFVTGTDSQLYHNWVGKGSSGYESLGGALTSSPAATQKTLGVIDVFARGSTGSFAALYQISYNYPGQYHGQWGVWTAIGGV